MQDLSSLTREPVPLAVEAWSPNHWMAREVLWATLNNKSQILNVYEWRQIPRGGWKGAVPICTTERPTARDSPQVTHLVV